MTIRFPLSAYNKILRCVLVYIYDCFIIGIPKGGWVGRGGGAARERTTKGTSGGQARGAADRRAGKTRDQSADEERTRPASEIKNAGRRGREDGRAGRRGSAAETLAEEAF